jgi:hypothetical protein
VPATKLPSLYWHIRRRDIPDTANSIRALSRIGHCPGQECYAQSKSLPMGSAHLLAAAMYVISTSSYVNRKQQGWRWRTSTTRSIHRSGHRQGTVWSLRHNIRSKKLCRHPATRTQMATALDRSDNLTRSRTYYVRTWQRCRSPGLSSGLPPMAFARD